jgi:hypothetical protein
LTNQDETDSTVKAGVGLRLFVGGAFLLALKGPDVPGSGSLGY